MSGGGGGLLSQLGTTSACGGGRPAAYIEWPGISREQSAAAMEEEYFPRVVPDDHHAHDHQDLDVLADHGLQGQAHQPYNVSNISLDEEYMWDPGEGGLTPLP